ncbi:MAG: phosphate ABC transporter substrate-binding protein PstS family protein [Christensenellales bacterium]|jgi:phosphate transport system substrate-binding protein
MKKRIITILFVLIAALALSACNNTAAPAQSPETTAPATQPTQGAESSDGGENSDMPSGTISVVGSTSVGPVMEAIVAKYNETNPDLVIEIQQVGSSAGIKAALDGTADIGMSSRDLKDEEVAQGVVPTEIALDGIAIIVNNDSKVSELTSEQIQKIFKGEITNWKDVGGDDADITVISREEGSGTRAAFEELLGLVGKIEKDGKEVEETLVSERALIQEGTGSVKAAVAGNPNAIGYISLGVADDTIKALKVDGAEATVENVLDKSYKVMRPFLAVTNGEPEGLAKVFLDYILSEEAQEVVESKSYIKVN